MGCRAAAADIGGGGGRLLLFAVVLLGAISLQAQSIFGLDTSGGLCATLVQQWGYPCNEHTVQTDDGFLLGVQNIPHGKNKPPSDSPGVPVFLQHGIFAGGDNWVFNQPSESLGFILADAGYDVWIGNIRGIQWSHGNVNLNTGDEEFWDWSWDELAAYDIPAMLEYVHNQTNSQLLYIGHSQGTSILMAALVGTDKAESLTSILTGAVLICPIVSLEHMTSDFDRVAASIYLDVIVETAGFEEFSLHSSLGQDLVQKTCVDPRVNCSDLYEAVLGFDCCMNQTQAPFYLNFYPQPTSSRNLGHFAQIIRDNVFRKYDYGYIANLKHYQQWTPPVYEISNFPASVPVMIIHGGQDGLADSDDVLQLVDKLGSKVKKVFSVERYAHADFLVSTTANLDVYPEITSFLQHPWS